MRVFKYWVLIVCVFTSLCILDACKKEDHFRTVFPLDEKVVVDSLEKVGLPGIISEAETYSKNKDDINYVIRSETECYDGTENKLFIAGITSADYKGRRVLYTVFDQSVASDQIEWSDWKQQILFAGLLYGGFENEEDVYQAFIGKELPDGETSFGWEAQVPGGYCTVSYQLRSNTIYDENRFPVKKRSAFLRVNIYESYELYQELKTDQESVLTFPHIMACFSPY